jgi:hypothetical protein
MRIEIRKSTQAARAAFSIGFTFTEEQMIPECRHIKDLRGYRGSHLF